MVDHALGLGEAHNRTQSQHITQLQGGLIRQFLDKSYGWPSLPAQLQRAQIGPN